MRNLQQAINISNLYCSKIQYFKSSIFTNSSSCAVYPLESYCNESLLKQMFFEDEQKPVEEAPFSPPETIENIINFLLSKNRLFHGLIMVYNEHHV